MGHSKRKGKALNASISRRQLLSGTAATAAFYILPRHLLAGGSEPAPSEKLNIASVGLGAMGADNLRACEDENIVALCDVDWSMASVTFRRYPGAKRYKDYRRMLDKEKNIDAVIVATPDHTHAVITAAALQQGKHVYTQMPLAHNVWEARQLTRIARETGLATQMGNERYSGPTIRSPEICRIHGNSSEVTELFLWAIREKWFSGRQRPGPIPARPVQYSFPSH